MIFNATVLADEGVSVHCRVYDPDVEQWYTGSGWTATEASAYQYALTEKVITDTSFNRYSNALTLPDGNYTLEYVYTATGEVIAEEQYYAEAVTSTAADPTLAAICSEALKKAGYSSGTSQYTSLLARAENYWAEEVKNDIFGLVKNPKFLQKTGIVSLTAYKARYSFPADFSTPIVVTLLSASITGTAQAGAASTITLALTDTMTASYAQGKEIVITGGTGANQIRQIISYNATTKVATVDMAWSTNPSTDSTYMIVESYDPLKEEPVWKYDSLNTEISVGTPYSYFPEGDKQSAQTTATYTGGFSVADTPDTTYTYAVKIRYYVDLMKVSLSSTTDPTIGVLYSRWRNVFIQGIYCKALQNQDDTRYAGEFGVYDKLLKAVQARETYGVDMNDLRMRVVD